MPADEGHRDDSQRKEADVDEKDKRAHSPLPVTSIPPQEEPDGTWALSPQPLCLIIPLHNAGTSVVPDHMQKELLPEENTEPNAAGSEKKSNWKSTAYASAKLLLRGVRDSADAFGPLKSVAGGLCFILENCEVWSSLARIITPLTGT